MFSHPPGSRCRHALPHRSIAAIALLGWVMASACDGTKREYGVEDTTSNANGNPSTGTATTASPLSPTSTTAAPMAATAPDAPDAVPPDTRDVDAGTSDVADASVILPSGTQPEPTMEPAASAPTEIPTAPMPSLDVTPEPSAPAPPATEVPTPTPSASEMPPEPVDEGPYAPRSGAFKMLIYSINEGFAHDSIPQGVAMLQEIGQEQGFETVVAADNSDITLDGLSQYEIVFFMNPTGDIFNATEELAYEDWMTTKNGAFGGVHSATDTERSWAFYKEVTGQYYDLHDPCCAEAPIEWQAGALNHPAVQGLPSPWTRAEEWHRFNSSASWSTKAGFTILSTVTTAGGGTRPVSFVREYGNFRSFYTSLGHEGTTFEDANVRKHITAGILWAVRREAAIPQ